MLRPGFDAIALRTMTHDFLRVAPLLTLLAIAAVTDLRSRRIPNWLTFLLMLSGILQSFFATRIAGTGMSVLGILIGAAIPFVLFFIGALGAGDVKLLAGIGAWMGPLPAVAVFLVEAVVGMVIVLAQATAQGRLQLLMKNSALVALNLFYVREVGVEHASATGRSARSINRPLPYAVPVLIAVLIVLARKWA
jgi:prepilin peptidase CpaA